MADQTWIDVASGIVDRVVSLTTSDTPFTAQQNAVLEVLLRKFGEGIGQEIGRQIVGLHDRFNSHNIALQHSIDAVARQIAALEVCERKGTSLNADDSSLNHSQCAAASSGKMAASSRPSKTQLRRIRRKRCSEKVQISRHTLLKLRPTTEVHQICEFNEKPKVKDVVTLNLAAAIPWPDRVDDEGTAPMVPLERHPVDVYQGHVESARLMQRWWRQVRKVRPRSDDADTRDSTQTHFEVVVESLLSTSPKNRILKRYNFVRRAESVLTIFEKEDVEISKIELYESASVALVSYSSQGSALRRKFVVDDRKRLVQLVQERSVRIVSHLQKRCPD